MHARLQAYAKYGLALFALLLAGVLVSRQRQTRTMAAAGLARIATLVALGLNQPIGDVFAEAGPYVTDPHILRRGGVRVAADLDAADGEASADVGLTAYRIVQEGLANAARHAPGATVLVAMRHRAEAVEAEIVDDGPGGAAGSRSGYGLVGLAEQMQGLGGVLAVDSPADGSGFRVSAGLLVGCRARVAP